MVRMSPAQKGAAHGGGGVPGYDAKYGGIIKRGKEQESLSAPPESKGRVVGKGCGYRLIFREGGKG